jgi:hypothetical protein
VVTSPPFGGLDESEVMEILNGIPALSVSDVDFGFFSWNDTFTATFGVSQNIAVSDARRLILERFRSSLSWWNGSASIPGSFESLRNETILEKATIPMAAISVISVVGLVVILKLGLFNER